MISNKRVGKKRPNYFLTDDEVMLLWKYSREWSNKWQCLIGLCAFRGLRIGEAVAINIHDFQPNGRLRIKLQKSYVVDDFPLFEEFQQLLNDYIKNNLHTFKNGYLFPYYSHRNKKQPNHMTSTSASAMFEKLRSKIGKDHPEFLERSGEHRYRIGWHSLRRWHETKLWDYSKDKMMVRDIMRYKDSKTVDVYINPYETWKKEREILSGVFSEFFNATDMFSKGQMTLKDFDS